MSRKKNMYMVLDTETCSYDFLHDMEFLLLGEEARKKVAIIRPLIYDIGWTICDREGFIYEKKQYLIAETFSVPSIFNTAYYREKRPIYLKMLEEGKTEIKSWNEAMKVFEEDLKKVVAVGAYNASFDFFRAIPHTELYIKHLYNADFYEWRERQKNLCYKIATTKNTKPNPDYDPNFFHFRGEEYPIFDLWGLACGTLLNNNTYKKKCLEYELLTNSGDYFKTSAEASFQYLCNNYDFVEEHTALSDAEIETYILAKIAKRKAIKTGVEAFPFRKLGNTIEFVESAKRIKEEHIRVVYKKMDEYIQQAKPTAYKTQMENKKARIEILLEQY